MHARAGEVSQELTALDKGEVMSVKVIVACGSGVATSQTVASKVNRMLDKDKIDAHVEAVDLKSVGRYLKDAAAYITIVRDEKKYDLPIIDGIAFLTGVGQKQQYEKLLKAIKEYKG